MFREGTCPKCHEKIQVPDDREKILCMYCGEEILVARTLKETPKKADAAAYEENRVRALKGLQEVIQTCQKPMQDFRRDRYEGLFDAFYTSHRSVFEAMEYIWQAAEEPEDWLREMVEHTIDTVKEDLSSYKSKGQRNQRLLDHNFRVSVYLIPALRKYPAKVSEPFADQLIASWNDTFGTTLGKATYDEINSGFRRKLCYITTAVCQELGKGADCRELRLLKNYRDQYLDTTPEGHALVEEYYNIAPTIVKRIDRQPDRSRIYGQIYRDYLLPCIRKIEERDYEACGAGYEKMVLELKARFMSETGCPSDSKKGA